MLKWGINSSVQGVATSFGNIGCELKYETADKALCKFTIEPISEQNPGIVEITFPFVLKRILSVSSNVYIDVKHEEGKTIVTFPSGNAVLLLEK